MNKTFTPLTLACLLAAAAAAATASPAGATTTGSTVTTSNGGILYTAGPGQANNPKVSITHADGSTDWFYTITDVAPITPAGNACSRPDPADPNTATCRLSESGDFYPELRMLLGDKVDHIDFSAADKTGMPGYASVFGGPGNDVLVATGAEYLWGDDGNDVLNGGVARGGNGNDTILNADDALGDAGNDTITGTNSLIYPDRLLGGPGNDTISAGAGDDYVYGNSGNDRILGGPGKDALYGGPGNDTIYGNSGNDHLEGGPGKDVLSGGPGKNTLQQ
jgi:Ca2+-binding RTX toxin-like protein